MRERASATVVTYRDSRFTPGSVACSSSSAGSKRTYSASGAAPRAMKTTVPPTASEHLPSACVISPTQASREGGRLAQKRAPSPRSFAVPCRGHGRGVSAVDRVGLRRRGARLDGRHRQRVRPLQARRGARARADRGAGTAACSGPPPAPSLYERLGKQEGLDGLVDELMGNVLADKRISKLFDRARKDKDRAKQLHARMVAECASSRVGRTAGTTASR